MRHISFIALKSFIPMLVCLSVPWLLFRWAKVSPGKSKFWLQAILWPVIMLYNGCVALLILPLLLVMVLAGIVATVLLFPFSSKAGVVFNIATLPYPLNIALLKRCDASLFACADNAFSPSSLLLLNGYSVERAYEVYQEILGRVEDLDALLIHQNADGYSALKMMMHYADDRDTKILDLVVSSIIDMDRVLSAQNKHGQTVLHEAVVLDKATGYAFLKNLLSRVRHVDQVLSVEHPVYGSPLHYAAMFGNKEVLKLFLDHIHNRDALLTRRNSEGKTVLDYIKDQDKEALLVHPNRFDHQASLPPLTPKVEVPNLPDKNVVKHQRLSQRNDRSGHRSMGKR